MKEKNNSVFKDINYPQDEIMESIKKDYKKNKKFCIIFSLLSLICLGHTDILNFFRSLNLSLLFFLIEGIFMLTAYIFYENTKVWYNMLKDSHQGEYHEQ